MMATNRVNRVEAARQRKANQRHGPTGQTPPKPTPPRSRPASDLDTTKAIDALGAIHVPDQEEGYYMPWSLTQRDVDDPTEATNRQVAAGKRGRHAISSNATMPLLRDESGAPLLRDNMVARLDPDHQEAERAYRYALGKLADAAQADRRAGKVRGERRYLAWTLDQKKVPMKQIAAQLGVSVAHAYNYRSMARVMLRAYMDAYHDLKNRVS